MRLALLTHPVLDPGSVAVDEDGVVWARRGRLWLRGCVVRSGLHAFLLPPYAVAWEPLTLETYGEILGRTPA